MGAYVVIVAKDVFAEILSANAVYADATTVGTTAATRTASTAATEVARRSVGRQAASTHITAAILLRAFVAGVAVFVGLAFGHVAVIPAVFLAGTAKQVFQSCDGALVLFVGCEVTRRYA
jgi:hypothetical protein